MSGISIEKRREGWRKASLKYIHSDKGKETVKKYHHSEQGKKVAIKAVKKFWVTTHGRKQKQEQERHYREKHKWLIFELLGNKCSNPYKLNHGDFLIDSRVLQIDHVNGQGTKELHETKGRSTYYKKVYGKILNGSKEYQLLCANCNWIKNREKKEYLSGGKNV